MSKRKPKRCRECGGPLRRQADKLCTRCWLQPEMKRYARWCALARMERASEPTIHARSANHAE
jgi:hypothetical protein